MSVVRAEAPPHRYHRPPAPMLGMSYIVAAVYGIILCILGILCEYTSRVVSFTNEVPCWDKNSPRLADKKNKVK